MSEAVLLYDSDCGFCRWSIDRIMIWDRGRRLRPVALQSREAVALLSAIAPEKKLDSWHLLAPDGRLHSGGAVAVPLLRLLPGGRPLALVAGAFPGLVERVYRTVARRRDRLGGLVGARCEIDPAGPREDAEALHGEDGNGLE